MKKLILFVSQKKIIRILLVLFFIAIAISAYILLSIRHNVQKMTESANETVTYFPEYPQISQSNDLVKRGEYLVKAGDCIACHTNTAKKGSAFAGGLAMYTPFGTIYSPNITPDKETGIGNWTEDQFIKAMREGISPEGHYYYPAFPYLYFNKISTDDLKAMKAYLDNIPAIKQPNQKNDMVWPFNWRFMQLGWRMIFFHPDTFKKDSEASDELNRGAYLAETFGHCAMCHTPSYHILSENIPLGAPIRKYDLTGSKVQGFLAPDITEGNLNNISVEEIIDVFTKDKMIGGGKVEGPMLEVNHDSLRYMTQADLRAIAVYLKAVESETPPKPKAGSGGVGKALYEQYCSGCHASGAGGAPKFGDPTGWEPVMKEGIDKVYNNAIIGKGGMPAKGTCLSCTDDEIKQAVDYMVASLTGSTSHATPIVPKQKPLTLADGQRIYNAKCAVCHNGGLKDAPRPGDKAVWQPIIDAGFVQTYLDVITGRGGHPVHGACPTCTDSEIKAAVKYMMQESSTGKDFSLW